MSDDSDATVLGDEEGPHSQQLYTVPSLELATKSGSGSKSLEQVSESPGATGHSPSSPSLLHSSLRQLIQQRSTREHDTIVTVKTGAHQQSCSDNIMSQEFPPLSIYGPQATTHTGQEVNVPDCEQNTAETVNSLNLTTEATASKVLSDNNVSIMVYSTTRAHNIQSDLSNQQILQPVSTSAPILQSIADQQTALLHELQQFPLRSDSNQSLTSAKSKAASLEQSLKTISSANQAERKRLAEAHSSLSQSVNSQQEFISESQALKQQLLSLSSKQKLLLECFSRQRDIGAQLSRLTPAPKEIHSSDSSSLAPVRMVAKNITSSMASLPISFLETHQATTQPTRMQIQQSLTTTASHSPPHPQAAPGTTSTTSQSTQEHTSKQTAGKTTSGKPPSSADLGEPVPLEMLVKHGFLQPGTNNLSCVILGCKFHSSLMGNGSIQSREGTTYQQPQHWIKACWAQLGHPHKQIKKKLAYTSVLYEEQSLISYCEQYSLKQVSSYLSKRSSATGRLALQSVPTQTLNPTAASEVTQTSLILQKHSVSVPPPPKKTTHLFNISQLLRECSVLFPSTSPALTLPGGFWASQGVPLTPHLLAQIQADLDW